MVRRITGLKNIEEKIKDIFTIFFVLGVSVLNNVEPLKGINMVNTTSIYAPACPAFLNPESASPEALEGNIWGKEVNIARVSHIPVKEAINPESENKNINSSKPFLELNILNISNAIKKRKNKIKTSKNVFWGAKDDIIPGKTSKTNIRLPTLKIGIFNLVLYAKKVIKAKTPKKSAKVILPSAPELVAANVLVKKLRIIKRDSIFFNTLLIIF